MTVSTGGKVDIGVRLPPCKPLPEMATFAAKAEHAGFNAIYVPDSQTLWRDAYLTLYAAARRTDRLTLATAVSNVATRHPSVIAGLVRSLDEVAPGRLVLGLGVGHSSVEPIGLRASTGSELRSGVDQIRHLVTGDEVVYGPATARLRDPRPVPVPIHIAATGPRNLHLAGEIADGAILLSGVAKEPLLSAITNVRAGAVAAGRRPADLQITVSAHTLVTDNVERDARILKPIIASIAQRGGKTALRSADLEISVPGVIPEVRPDLVHAEDWSHAIDVCSRWITDADAAKFAKTFCLFGSPDDIVEQIHEVHLLGVTSIFLQHVGSWELPHALVDAIGGDVIPRLDREITRTSA